MLEAVSSNGFIGGERELLVLASDSRVLGVSKNAGGVDSGRIESGRW